MSQASETDYKYDFIFVILILSVVYFLTACGGGSQGTGTEPRTSFAGKIQSTDSNPIGGAQITVVETGEKTISDSEGNFNLNSSFVGGSTELIITTDQGSSTVVIDENITSQGAAIVVGVEVGSGTQLSSADSLTITAKIEGDCDIYFENNRVIRQSNQIQDGKICPFRIKVFDGHIPISGSSVYVQKRGCDDNLGWVTIKEGIVGIKTPGIVDVNFKFSTKPDFCLYRALVVVGENPAQEFIVRTFRKQKYDEQIRK